MSRAVPGVNEAPSARAPLRRWFLPFSASHISLAGTGLYGRYGFALGTTSGGDLWLKNGNGVIIHLVAKRQGLMLSLGGDAVVIRMNQ